MPRFNASYSTRFVPLGVTQSAISQSKSKYFSPRKCSIQWTELSTVAADFVSKYTSWIGGGVERDAGKCSCCDIKEAHTYWLLGNRDNTCIKLEAWKGLLKSIKMMKEATVFEINYIATGLPWK